MNASRSPAAIAVLISGRGTNMRVLIEASRAANSPYRVALVVSDRPDAAGLPLARELGVPIQAIPAGKHIERSAYDRQVAAAIEAAGPELIVLAGFMRILSADFVERFAGRIVNIHPSLLPLHPGLNTHRAVLAAGESTHGATVHFVTARLDAGPRIIQAAVPVRPGDDAAALAARVQAVEHRIYPLAVRWYCEGRLRLQDGAAWLDGRPLIEPVQYTDRLGAT